MSLSIESIAKLDLGELALWRCDECDSDDPCYVLIHCDDGKPLRCLFCDGTPYPMWKKTEEKERVMGEEFETSDTGPSCDECCFFQDRDDLPGYDGDCHFSAPECGTRCARWPETKLSWWCADFEQVKDDE